MKPKKILVDTSAWILSFKKSGPEELQTFLKNGIDQNIILTTPLVILELLQGCKTEREYAEFKERFGSLDNCLLESIQWEKAYRFGFMLRKKGITVPTMDILIAFLSIENGCVLLHHDNHFRLIAKHSDLEALDFLT
ncbi:MAG: PIN domain-containing protein [Nitrospirae bacterium]|nr:PIN domain-containing protein [Nitrospirota bacterium]